MVLPPLSGWLVNPPPGSAADTIWGSSVQTPVRGWSVAPRSPPWLVHRALCALLVRGWSMAPPSMAGPWPPVCGWSITPPHPWPVCCASRHPWLVRGAPLCPTSPPWLVCRALCALPVRGWSMAPPSVAGSWPLVRGWFIMSPHRWLVSCASRHPWLVCHTPPHHLWLVHRAPAIHDWSVALCSPPHGWSIMPSMASLSVAGPWPCHLCVVHCAPSFVACPSHPHHPWLVLHAPCHLCLARGTPLSMAGLSCPMPSVAGPLPPAICGWSVMLPAIRGWSLVPLPSVAGPWHPAPSHGWSIMLSMLSPSMAGPWSCHLCVVCCAPSFVACPSRFLPFVAGLSCPLTTVAGLSCPLLSVAGPSCPLLSVAGPSCPLPSVAGLSCPLPSVACPSRPLLSVACPSRPLPSVAGLSCPLPSVACPSRPLPSVASHRPWLVCRAPPSRAHRLPGRLGRSESLRVAERKRSQRGSAKGKQPRSRSDVDLEAAARAGELQERPPLAQGRPRPGNVTPEPGGAGGGEPPPSFLPPQSEETEPRVVELEPEPPTWRQRVPPDALLRLKKGEVKRQEVINELFLTEHAHVRMLRVLLEVFYQPLLSEGFFLEMELTNIFPSLDDLIEAHALFLESLKKLREESDCVIAEIGDALLARFDGPEGGWFQKISARFCSRQSFALEQLKAKQRKEPRFSQFIQEAESLARCRRLQLKDIIPTEMQRLTKYPLLLENIAKYTEEEEERAKVQRAAECCRQILNHVNQEVRHMENLMKLKDYQKRLDLSSLKQSTDPLLSEFKNTDITKRNLVHEGPLTWRVSRDKAVEVHVLLLDDILVLLQRQEERLVLRCHSRPAGPVPEARQVLSPIIKLRSAMTREVATDHKAFYVIFSWENGAQIYELVAQSVSERKNWCALISDTAGSLKLPEVGRLKPRRSGHSLSAPHSPSYYREPLLSSSENGNSAKETLPTDEREKDGAPEGAPEGVVFEKPEKDPERMLAELLLLHKPRAAGEEALAGAALERVAALKRLLLGEPPLPEDGDPGSPVDTWHRAPENRGAGHETQERDACARSEGEPPGEAPNGPSSLDWGSRHPDGEGPASPLVLTPQQREHLRLHFQQLEEAVLRLKDMEEGYSQLQQLLAKHSSDAAPSCT